MASSDLRIKSVDSGGYHVLTLGSATQRQMPAEGTAYWLADRLDLDFSAGSFNVAAAAAVLNPYGVRAAHYTCLPRGKKGLWARSQGGKKLVDMKIRWLGHDGVYGPNIAETRTDAAFGSIAPSVEYMRSREAAAEMSVKDDLAEVKALLDAGVGVIHSDGIFIALSQGTSDLVAQAFQEARRAGTLTSFDINVRKKMWAAGGRQEKIGECYRAIVEQVDVLFGNVTDIRDGLAIEPDDGLEGEAAFRNVAEKVIAKFPAVKVVVQNLRKELSSSRHLWSAQVYHQGQVHTAHGDGEWREIEVRDRTGGGDATAGGFLFAVIAGKSMSEAICFAAGCGACAAATPGDTLQVHAETVECSILGNMEIDR